MLKLYDYFRSSAAFRTRLALNYKQLDYEQIKISLLDGDQLKPKYHAINPSNLVPALVIEDNKILHQSLAIIEYLDEEYPNPPLLPAIAYDKAYVRMLSLDVACDIHPLNNLRVLKYLKSELGHDQETVDKWYHHWIHKGLASIEQSLKNGPFYQGKYCYKEQFTLSDVCLLPQIANARRFNCALDAYPTLIAIEAYCKQHDFVLKAYPENQ